MLKKIQLLTTIMISKSTEKNLAKISSVLFLIIFAVCVVTGLQVEWFSWLFGLAAGVSIVELLIPKLRR